MTPPGLFVLFVNGSPPFLEVEKGLVYLVFFSDLFVLICMHFNGIK